MIPVLLVHLRLGRLRLWLPVFLVWPLLLALFILVFPFAFIYSLLKLRLRAFQAWFLGVPQVYSLLCALRGVRVLVRDPRTRFEISCI